MDGLFIYRYNPYIIGMNNEVLEIAKRWEVVVEIKRRCQSVTEEDMANLADMVNHFNAYMAKHEPRFRPIRKMSGCLIPAICGQVAGFLKVQGAIDNVYSTKLKPITREKPVYKF